MAKQNSTTTAHDAPLNETRMARGAQRLLQLYRLAVATNRNPLDLVVDRHERHMEAVIDHMTPRQVETLAALQREAEKYPVNVSANRGHPAPHSSNGDTERILELPALRPLPTRSTDDWTDAEDVVANALVQVVHDGLSQPGKRRALLAITMAAPVWVAPRQVLGARRRLQKRANKRGERLVIRGAWEDGHGHWHGFWHTSLSVRAVRSVLAKCAGGEFDAQKAKYVWWQPGPVDRKWLAKPKRKTQATSVPKMKRSPLPYSEARFQKSLTTHNQYVFRDETFPLDQSVTANLEVADAWTKAGFHLADDGMLPLIAEQWATPESERAREKNSRKRKEKGGKEAAKKRGGLAML